MLRNKDLKNRLQEERALVRQLLHDSNALRQIVFLWIMEDIGTSVQANEASLLVKYTREKLLCDIYEYLNPDALRSRDVSLLEQLNELEKDEMETGA